MSLFNRSTVAVLTITAAILLLACSAAADWKPGDPVKMTNPQLPDPTGFDVNMTYPKVLADDWKCSETGPVSDIHFWFSYPHDAVVPIAKLHVSIHKDIPAVPPTAASRPGDVLWQRDFAPTQLTLVYPAGTGLESWYDPNTGLVVPGDHQTYGQVNITNITDPFVQTEGTIYWLDLSVVTAAGTNAQIGWKTALPPHFLDDAVWGDYITTVNPYDGPALWTPMVYPSGPNVQQSMDMAFVITPEPGMMLLIPGLALLALRRRR
ncbi:MAG: hypothetical protein ACHRHE_10275 [Tepidisphaerales bacterium]